MKKIIRKREKRTCYRSDQDTEKISEDDGPTEIEKRPLMENLRSSFKTIEYEWEVLHVDDAVRSRSKTLFANGYPFIISTAKHRK